MKKNQILFLILVTLFSCSSDDSEAPTEKPIGSNVFHRCTFTVSGSGIDDVTYIKEIPFDEDGGVMSYF